MSIDFQKEKERIELKHSTYIGSIGIYMEFSEKIEDAFFKYYFYDGIREEEAINFIFSMFSSIVEEHLKGQKILDIERDLFQICNTEYVFYIYDCGKGTFLFDWNPKLADLDAALLLYYALKKFITMNVYSKKATSRYKNLCKIKCTGLY